MVIDLNDFYTSSFGFSQFKSVSEVGNGLQLKLEDSLHSDWSPEIREILIFYMLYH